MRRALSSTGALLRGTAPFGTGGGTAPSRSRLGTLGLFLVTFAASAVAQPQPPRIPSSNVPPQLRNVRIDQKLNSQVPLDLKFRNERGETVEMRQLLGKKPVILALVYYSCPRLCNMTLNGLTAAMKVLPFTVGNEYEVVTVSFDPREGPELAANKKKSYLKEYRRPGAEEGWHFLTGSQVAIQRLTGAVGFGFEFDDKKNEFAHASGLIVLTPSGRVSKYFYGVEYSGRDLRLGLVDAAARKIGSPVDQVLLYCFHYDPSTGKYSMGIMNTIRAGGILTLGAMIGLVAFSVIRERRKRRERREWSPAT